MYFSGGQAVTTITTYVAYSCYLLDDLRGDLRLGLGERLRGDRLDGDRLLPEDRLLLLDRLRLLFLSRSAEEDLKKQKSCIFITFVVLYQRISEVAL